MHLAPMEVYEWTLLLLTAAVPLTGVARRIGVPFLAFVLNGLQLRPILMDLGAERRLDYLRVAGCVLLMVVAVRIAWVMFHNAAARRKSQRRTHRRRSHSVRSSAHDHELAQPALRILAGEPSAHAQLLRKEFSAALERDSSNTGHA
jgi:cytochrome b561